MCVVAHTRRNVFTEDIMKMGLKNVKSCSLVLFMGQKDYGAYPFTFSLPSILLCKLFTTTMPCSYRRHRHASG